MAFIDIETGEKVTLYQLRKEFQQLRKEQPDEYNYPFSDYVRNCLAIHNGTLELIK